MLSLLQQKIAQKITTQELGRTTIAWGIHGLTASGALVGLVALYAIAQGDYKMALWAMVISTSIDAFDGPLARMINIKKYASQLDGGLLDNIVDYLNYVVVPAFFLLMSDLLPAYTKVITVSIIVLVSAYQFSQVDAKTKDHFFRGFPSYWNIVVFYFFLWQMAPFINLLIILILAALVFVPIKYVHPSRLDHFTHNRIGNWSVFSLTMLWGLATILLLWMYPQGNTLLSAFTIFYMLFYFSISLYRTLVPLTD